MAGTADLILGRDNFDRHWPTSCTFRPWKAWGCDMIDVQEIDKLIAHAMRWGHGKLDATGFDVASAARRERVAHVASELHRLGHATLAAELLKLENLSANSLDITPAA